MTIRIPLSYQEIVDEITQFTDLPREEVERGVWQEAVGPRIVTQEVARYGVTPHKYDEKMEQLYREGNGFIFETLVYWATPERQQFGKNALDRVQAYASEAGLEPGQVNILILGDGTGNDTLRLTQHGFIVDYFEVPGSKTYNFALRRFQHYELLGTSINMIEDYRSCFERQYDIVISFEVLEHLPDPLTAIRDMRAMLKPNGIALVSEAFHGLSGITHLEKNIKLAGKTPFLFLKNGMVLRWFSKNPLFKPMEFVKRNDVSRGASLGLLRNKSILVRYLVLSPLIRLRLSVRRQKIV